MDLLILSGILLDVDVCATPDHESAVAVGHWVTVCYSMIIEFGALDRGVVSWSWGNEKQDAWLGTVCKNGSNT